MCRQVIREFCPLDMEVLLVPADYSKEYPLGTESGSGAIQETTLEALLPHSFGPEHLKLPRTG